MKTLLLLHVLLLFYSFADVASKFAAGFEMLSWGFVICYGLVLVILAGYALGWQQVIKRIPLTTAYANRGITVVWGIFWGAVFFSEAVTPFKLVGAAMIIAGIALFSHADAEGEAPGSDDKGDLDNDDPLAVRGSGASGAVASDKRAKGGDAA